MSHRAAKRKERLWAWLLGSALLLATGQASAAGAPSAQCVASCERHISDRTTRAQVCGRCLLLGDRRAGWLEVAAERRPYPEAVIRSAMDDEDWAVSEAALRVQAKHAGQRPEAVAARWLVHTKGPARARACAHLFRSGAAKQQSFAKVRSTISKRGGRDGAAAARALKACEPGTRGALELELYAIDPRTQLEAVRHLAALLALTPAGAVLEAMQSRPPQSDPIAARALLLDAKGGGVPVGLALLRVAKAENQDRVNRLVAIYAQEIRDLARGRSSRDPLARKGVVAELRPYGPLATPELEALLTDEDTAVRLSAAHAIVESEGGDFERAVRDRVRPQKGSSTRPLSPEQQARWVALYAGAGRSHCDGHIVRELAKDDATPAPVRAAALQALAACGGKDAQRTVLEALHSEDAQVRASAVAALIDAPRSKAVSAAAAKALADPSAQVQAAALPVVAAQHQSALSRDIALLLTHADAKVRAAAVRALGTLAARAHVSAVADRLQGDADRDVRIAAVEALGEMGGAVAVGALTEAAAKDPESRVRYLARQRLGAMGFHR